MGTAFLVQEVNERLLVTTTIVSDRVRLVVLALSEELDGGKGRNPVHLGDGLVVTCIGIHVGDDTVRLGLEVPSYFLVDWFQRFAVSAPRSGESDENVLGVVQCDGIEVVNVEGYDLGWGRWFDAGFDTGLFGDAVRWLIQAGVDD